MHTQGNVSSAIIFPAIYTIALGTGGIKPNVCTYGAEQFDPKIPRDRKELDSFFNWFYWSINLGALISYTLVATVCQFGIKSLGGVEWRFAVGFTIPLVCMILAILAFVAGTPRYKSLPPAGSVLATAMKIIVEASMTKRRVYCGAPTWLDKAKRRFGGSFDEESVDGVKYVWRLLPFLMSMIPYWSVYNQMSTSFQNQVSIYIVEEGLAWLLHWKERAYSQGDDDPLTHTGLSNGSKNRDFSDCCVNP